MAISTYNKNVLITTKKHWLRDKNRFMTFEEIFGSSINDQHNPFAVHEILGIDLIESTPEEIKAVATALISSGVLSMRSMPNISWTAKGLC